MVLWRIALTTVIEISGLLEKQLQLLVDIGLYSSKTEAVRDAVRRLLNSVNIADVAVKIYSQGRISLAYASELAEQSIPEFFIKLLGKGIVPRLVSSRKNVEEVVENIDKKKVLVFDVSSLYVTYLSETLDVFRRILTYLSEKRNVRNIVSPDTILHLKFIELKRLISFGHRSTELPLTLANVDANEFKKFNNKFIKEQSITTAEMTTQYLAYRLKAILVTDDYKALEIANKTNVYAISTMSLLNYAKYHRIISDVKYAEAREKLETIYSMATG